jgi:hypothetical protein
VTRHPPPGAVERDQSVIPPDAANRYKRGSRKRFRPSSSSTGPAQAHPGSSEVNQAHHAQPWRRPGLAEPHTLSHGKPSERMHTMKNTLTVGRFLLFAVMVTLAVLAA